MSFLNLVESGSASFAWRPVGMKMTSAFAMVLVADWRMVHSWPLVCMRRKSILAGNVTCIPCCFEFATASLTIKSNGAAFTKSEPSGFSPRYLISKDKKVFHFRVQISCFCASVKEKKNRKSIFLELLNLPAPVIISRSIIHHADLIRHRVFMLSDLNKK